MGTTSEDDRRGAHWDAAYRGRGLHQLSWYQTEATRSLELIRGLGTAPAAAVVDIGGGASGLAGSLVDRGFTDVTVLDVSAVALAAARARLADGPPVTWVHGDVLTWQPARPYGLWHDRAVFHFLTAAADRGRYLRTLAAALEPGAGVVLGTFAEDGPEYCSGLPVSRYSPDGLVDILGPGVEPVATGRELHTTPSGSVQPFTWLAAHWRG